jgi:hypothetical protein
MPHCQLMIGTILPLQLQDLTYLCIHPHPHIYSETALSIIARFFKLWDPGPNSTTVVGPRRRPRQTDSGATSFSSSANLFFSFFHFPSAGLYVRVLSNIDRRFPRAWRCFCGRAGGTDSERGCKWEDTRAKRAGFRLFAIAAPFTVLSTR